MISSVMPPAARPNTAEKPNIPGSSSPRALPFSCGDEGRRGAGTGSSGEVGSELSGTGVFSGA